MLAAIVLYWLSAPVTIDPASLPEHTADLTNGEQLFWAGGCASCHAAADAEGEAKKYLGGGLELVTPFGTFVAPNISSGEQGLGKWSNEDFINAMVKGVSPEGKHYYPAFPYTNYQIMPYQDLIDLKAYLDTLPAVASSNPDHQLSFPYNLRRGLGLWKRMYLTEASFRANPDIDASIERGRYLVDGPGHCGACHTPRDKLGATIRRSYLAGAPELEVDSTTGETSEGWVPNITPHQEGIGDWSEEDIAYLLESGFTPDYDSLGGSMASVLSNMAKLPADDHQAIAAYLKSIAAKP